MHEKHFNLEASYEQMIGLNIKLAIVAKPNRRQRIETAYTDEEFNAFKERARGDLIGEILTQHVGVEGVDFN